MPQPFSATRLAALAGRVERCHEELGKVLDEIVAAQKAGALPASGRQDGIIRAGVQCAAGELWHAQDALWTIVKAARRAAKREG